MLFWRRNLAYLILFFAFPFWVCAFALLLLGDAFLPGLLPGSFGKFSPLCVWFVLWWLNPLFDRMALHVVSRRYFEPGLSFRALFRGLGGSLGRGLAGDLLWRRFSPWRAAVLPLKVLERGGPARKRRRIASRKRALSNGGLHFCVFLSAWCFLLHWILIGGEIVFLALIQQLFFSSSPGLLGFIDIDRGGIFLFLYTIWCVNYLLVESLYVCMGFGIYLNSRVEVEGWDIELLFRKFITRRRKAGALVLLLFGLGLPRLGGVFAQSRSPGSEALPPDLGAAMPAEALEGILQRELQGERKTWTIRFKDDGDENEAMPFPGIDLGRWINFFREAAAVILRGALILAFAILALVCGIYLYRRRKSLNLPRPPRLSRSEPPPESPRVLPPGPESLLEEAGRSYRLGFVREAWGLCYAAALGALARRHRIRFPPGATEYRCLALVRRQAAAAGTESGMERGTERAFAELIRHWVALAYGGISPPGGAFEEARSWALSLCGAPRE
jgi:hypothetical protein